MQGFYATGPDQWGPLLRALRARRPEPLRVYLDAHPQKVREQLSAALEGAVLIDHEQDSVLQITAAGAEAPALQAQGYAVSAQEVYYDALP
ncbi:MAG: hypothetical protein Q4C67_06190 [Deinococcus sp.]|nr:hypothetical protein [Deinococcus sp.]